MQHNRIIFLLFISIPAFAYEEDIIYVVNSVTYDIDGITKIYALEYLLDIKEGEEIKGLSSLENLIQEKTQILLNERFFESVKIDYSKGQVRNDGKCPVDLFVSVKDSWNIFAFPYPHYDDNTGFSITLKARDYNFFGTMNPLKLDLGYSFAQDRKSSFSFIVDSDIPFKFLGLYWIIDFDNSLKYRVAKEEPWFYSNTTGISAEFPVNAAAFTIGFSESIYLNEENPSYRHNEYGQFQKGVYLSSSPYLNLVVPTGIKNDNYGELTYTAGLKAVFNHALQMRSLADFRRGPFFYFSHGLNFGRIDWIGNFRKGSALSVNNSFSYNFLNSKNNIQPLGATLDITAVSHIIFNEFSGLSARLMYRSWFLQDYNKNESSAADALRGIIDDAVKADYMISLNIDIPVRILKFRTSGGTGNFSRVFDFDLHMAPLFDAAFFHDPEINTSFGYDNLIFTGGMELIIFPQSFRSIFFRVSLAFGSRFLNARAKVSRELFIGMELFF